MKKITEHTMEIDQEKEYLQRWAEEQEEKQRVKREQVRLFDGK